MKQPYPIIPDKILAEKITLNGKECIAMLDKDVIVMLDQRVYYTLHPPFDLKVLIKKFKADDVSWFQSLTKQS